MGRLFLSKESFNTSPQTLQKEIPPYCSTLVPQKQWRMGTISLESYDLNLINPILTKIGEQVEDRWLENPNKSLAHWRGLFYDVTNLINPTDLFSS